MKNYISSRIFWLSSLFSIILLPSMVFGSFGCSFSWTANCTNPDQIYIGGDGTIEGGFSGVESAVKGEFTQKTITEFVVDTVLYFLSFVTLIAVIYVIYAGFQLMTGGGDEEKVKKARQIIVYVLAGIILMWSAYWIVIIIIESLE